MDTTIEPRIAPIDPETAEGTARTILESTKQTFGKHLNFFSTLANAPAVLDGYTGLAAALGNGTLAPKIREEIAVAISSQNGCDYCLTAHGHAAGANGIDADELTSLFDGRVKDPREQAAVTFALMVLGNQGRIADSDLATVRAAGLSNGEVLEIIAHVAMTVFSNTLNNVSNPEVDLPPLPVTA